MREDYKEDITLEDSLFHNSYSLFDIVLMDKVNEIKPNLLNCHVYTDKEHKQHILTTTYEKPKVVGDYLYHNWVSSFVPYLTYERMIQKLDINVYINAIDGYTEVWCNTMDKVIDEWKDSYEKAYEAYINNRT